MWILLTFVIFSSLQDTQSTSRSELHVFLLFTINGLRIYNNHTPRNLTLQLPPSTTTMRDRKPWRIENKQMQKLIPTPSFLCSHSSSWPFASRLSYRKKKEKIANEEERQKRRALTSTEEPWRRRNRNSREPRRSRISRSSILAIRSEALWQK